MALDAKGIVRDWINTRTWDLVGPGNPLANGAHLKRLRGPATGAYLRLTTIGGGSALTAENPVHRARLSATIYAASQGAADNAAVAYASLLETFIGKPVPMGDYRCLIVDNLSGPVQIDDSESTKEQYRCLVDADFYLTV
jgi:hypothetical protein